MLCFRGIGTMLYPILCKIHNGRPLTSWLASLTLDEVRQDMSLPRVVCGYEDVFSNKLPGLPPPRDVDFFIELYPSTSLISMTPHRMAPIELQEVKVQIQELLGKGFIRPRTSP